MADDNFFDPSPTASPNLDPADPLREWASQLQDPEIAKLMATDPQAAAKRMADMGIPPPPDHIHAYTDGLGPENNVTAFTRNLHSDPGTFGGADPALDPSTPVRTNPDGSIAQNVSTNPDAPIPGARPGSILDKLLRPAQAAADVPWGVPNPPTPLPTPDPRKSTLASDLDPAEPESVPLPQERPKEAGPGASDLSAKSKTPKADALSEFSKSLTGIKPIPPPPPNHVGTPSVRSPTAINAPNLQNLLSLVGQPGPNPLALTLGRLLATGKA